MKLLQVNLSFVNVPTLEEEAEPIGGADRTGNRQ